MRKYAIGILSFMIAIVPDGPDGKERPDGKCSDPLYGGNGGCAV